MNPIEKFARRLRNVEKLATKAATQPALAYSSIEDGAIQSVENGSLKAIIGKQWDGTQATTIVNGPTPPTPSTPWGDGSAMTATIRWDGLFVDGAILPMDFARVEVHISDDPEFTAETADTLISTIETPRGGEAVAARAPGTWYGKLVTRSLSGARSVASEAVEMTVTDTVEVVPTAPPEETFTVDASGDAVGITAVARGELAPSSVLNWYLNGDLIDSTRSVVYRFTADGSGASLQDGVGYEIEVEPANSVGSGSMSAPVVATLNQGVSANSIMGNVVVGFVLAGAIQVGGIVISPDAGIEIPLATGGVIRFPADGSDAIVDAVIRARSLVAENVRILGVLNYIEGGLQLSSGVSAPTTAPRVSKTWTDDGSGRISRATSAVDYDYDNTQLAHYRGLWDDDTRWLTAASTFDGSVYAIDKATGDVTKVFDVPQMTFNNRSVYQLPANGTSGHTTSPGNSSFLVAGKKFTPTVGRLLVAVCYGATSSTAPDGWTAAADSSAVNHGGLYVWWKVATDSNTVTVTHGSANHPAVVAFYEFPTGATFVGSASDNSVGYTTANPTLSGLTGTNVLMAAKGIDVWGTALDASGTWSTGVDEDFAVGAPNSLGADGYWATVGVVPSSGDDSFAPTCTITATSAESAEALTWAINVPGDAPDRPYGVQPSGGVVKVGTDFYTLVQDSTRGSAWYVYKFDSTGIKVSEWQFTNLANSAHTPALSTDGTDLYIARASSSNVMWVVPFSTAGVQGTAVNCGAFGSDATGLYVGSADFGAARFVVTYTTGMRVYNSSGVRQVGDEWTRGGGEGINGLAWDGTRFHTLAPSGKVWHYSEVVAAVERDFSYSWYDSDASGGTHETQPGPAYSFTIPLRCWALVDIDPPADGGGPDDPDSVRVYIDNHRQDELGPGITSVIYGSPDLSGAAGRTTNGFELVAGTNGFLQSTAADGNGPRVRLGGNGDWRLGRFEETAGGVFTNHANVPPTTIANSVGSGTITYSIVEGWVYIQVNLTGVSLVTGSATNLTAASALPAEARPAGTIYQAGFYANIVGYLSVNPAGTISARGGTGSMPNIAGSLIYPAT